MNLPQSSFTSMASDIGLKARLYFVPARRFGWNGCLSTQLRRVNVVAPVTW
jgi:hypothetical protein